MENLVAQLKNVIAGEVASDEESLTKYSRDASMFEVKPQAIVAPRDVEDVKALVQFATEHEGASLTARSGGTDMSGGPLTESIVVDMNTYFTGVVSVDSNSATVKPGTFYRDFEAATLQQGLLMPSYPASREICTVGGMVANNAGGEKTLKYGKTAEYVQQLKVVLADGNEYVVRKLTRAELNEKLAQDDFEGQLYQRLWSLIEKNQEELAQAKPDVTKNSAGYALWDVWDGHTFDATRLFTGSQGTLGIITEITFRLVKPLPHKRMVVLFLRSTDQLTAIVQRILRYQPETFESYDDRTLKLALRFLPSLVKQMGTKNVLSLGLSFLPELKLLLTGGLPKLVLLAEITGDDEAEVAGRAEAAAAAVRALGISVRVTRSEAEVRKYWTIRRESFNLLRSHVEGKRTAPFIDDVVVRADKLPQFLPRLDELMSHYDLTYTIAGHVGDGNFHIIPLVDPARPDLADIVDELSHKVYDLVVEFKGSITGEHNDGLIRTPFLEQMYGADIVRLFATVKKIFDARNIFNPGKKVGIDWEYAEEHLVRSL